MNGPLVIVYSNLGLGGIPVQIVDLVNGMEKTHKTTKIYIFLKKRRSFDIRTTITNPNVFFFNFYDVISSDNALLFTIWVWRHIFLLKPSTIFTFISPYALTALATKILFFWRKVTIVIDECHYTSTMVSYMAFPVFQRWGIRALYPLSDSIIVPTLAIFNDLHDTFHIPTKLIKVIPNWSRFAEAKMPTKKRPIDLLITGRFEKTKNILPFLKICKAIVLTSYPKLSCLMVGEGTQKKEIISYIKSNGLEKNIRIKKPTIHIARLISKSKIYICNSLKKSEGFPLAILDAMSLGTLIIARRFDGISEVLSNKCAIFVENNKEMSYNISCVLRNILVYRRRIKEAKRLVRKYHSKKNIDAYIQLFSI